MTFAEIIQKLRERDERVTRCFFFWEGPTMERILELRRTDPARAVGLRAPVCNTCRPALLKVLHTLYGTAHFDYNEKVSDFWFYLLKDDKLASIKQPDALMGWIVSTAYYFFLHEKVMADKSARDTDSVSLSNMGDDVEDDRDRAGVRDFVQQVLDAMPNRTYAQILDEVTLEVGQYKGKEKAEKMRTFAEKLAIPIDNLYVKVSLAKKQFKETALKLS
ncbi:MAG: hypothetical protein IJU68_05625 [Bacteroidales bacterium]|nr:hypothetical protein [Bacteroidales bacterium]